MRESADFVNARRDSARLHVRERQQLVAFLLEHMTSEERSGAVALVGTLAPVRDKYLLNAMTVGRNKSKPSGADIVLVMHADDCECDCPALADPQGPMVFHADDCTCQCNRPTQSTADAVAEMMG